MEGEILSEFVEKKIIDYCKRKGVANINIQFNNASEKCNSMTGPVLFATIYGTTNGVSYELDVVVKCAPTNTTDIRRDFPIKKLFNREIFYYSKIAPIYDSLQDEFELCVPKEMRCVLPKCLGICDEVKDELLIIENLKSKGYTMMRVQNLDYEHAAVLLRATGKLHALAFIYAERYPKGFEELAEQCNNDLLDNDEEYSDTTIYKYGKTIIKEFSDVIVDTRLRSRLLQAIGDDWSSRIKELWKRGNIKVILQGDTGHNNFFFRYKGKSPVEAVPKNFQWARYGSVAHDVMYLFALSATGSLRRNHFKQLIREYYLSLKSFLSLCGYEANKFCSYEDLKEEIRSQAVISLIMCMFFLPLTNFQDMPFNDFVSSLDYEAVARQYKNDVNDIVTDWVHFGFI